MRPYFAPEEMALLPPTSDAGVGRFPSPQGSKVTLESHGLGCRCPFFEPATNGCRIYGARPLDCRLYPFLLMRDPATSAVVLGMDMLCPFIQDHRPAPALVEYGRWLASYVEGDEMTATVAANPGLIQAYQDSAVVLYPLPRLDAAVNPPGDGGLRPLTLDDQPLVDLHLALARKATGTRLAAYAFPSLFLWRDLFDYSWTLIDEQLCIFAQEKMGQRKEEMPGLAFMPLPPLGARPSPIAVREAFRLMDRRNTTSALSPQALSRIEDVDETSRGFFEALGFRLMPKGTDYLYRREDLAALSGNRYRGKRSAYNACARRGVSYEPYRPEDEAACLALFESWRAGRRRVHADPLSLALLDDAAWLHRRALAEAEALGLIARVARLDGKVLGYLLGYSLGPDAACVLLEVSELTVTGVAQFLFREFCREQPLDVAFISAMDDSGLEHLRRVKQSYHPARLISSSIVTR